MKDREQNQFEGLKLPPTWCSPLCRNAMNEICIEDCAIKRDCSAFEPKPNLKLGDMPHFPLKESVNMTKEEKFASVTIYLAKVVDHLKGVEDEQYDSRFSRGFPTPSVDDSKSIAPRNVQSHGSQQVAVHFPADEDVSQLINSETIPPVSPDQEPENHEQHVD